MAGLFRRFYDWLLRLFWLVMPLFFKFRQPFWCCRPGWPNPSTTGMPDASPEANGEGPKTTRERSLTFAALRVRDM
jgi:hypothetical protein